MLRYDVEAAKKPIIDGLWIILTLYYQSVGFEEFQKIVDKLLIFA